MGKNTFMKIAVMSMNKSIESLVSDKFARSPYIIIYDTESNNYVAIENTGSQLKDGAGPQTADCIIKSGIEILLTKEIGVKAYSVLAKEHINIELIPSCCTVNLAIKQYLKNK